MELEEVKDFINQTKKKINKIPNDTISLFIIDEFEIPTFLNNKQLDYEYLKDVHFKINSYIIIIKKFIPVENELYKKYLIPLLKLKLQIDSLVKSNSNYTKTNFENNYQKLLGEFKNESYIILTETIKPKRLVFIKKLFSLLSNEEINRIDKTSVQRMAFYYLFLPFEKKEKVKWNGSIYDLKAFFDIILEFNFINTSKYFNEFITKHFAIRNKQNNFQSFTIKSFQTSNTKEGYNKESYLFWKEKLSQLKETFG